MLARDIFEMYYGPFLQKENKNKTNKSQEPKTTSQFLKSRPVI